MLTTLIIDSMAVIDHLELELGPGLNLITGETGAGKSVIVHCLELVLGGRARPSIVRAGAECATVEALFVLDADARAQLAEHLHDVPLDDEEVLIRRIVRANGRSRATINGRATTVSVLKHVAAGCVDISSQHEHHSLTDPRKHLAYLDAFAEHAPALAEVGTAFRSATKAHQEAQAARTALAERENRQAILQVQLEAIRAINPVAEELEPLEIQLKRMAHSEQLLSGAQRALGALEEREQDPAIDAVISAASDVAGLVRADETLQPLLAQLDGALNELRDVAEHLRDYVGSIEIDPRELDALYHRRDKLRALVRKHPPTTDDPVSGVLAHAERCENELEALAAGEDRLEQAVRHATALTTAAAKLATSLSAARREAAEALSQAITAELSTLGMGEAMVQMHVSDTSSGGLPVEGRRLTATGFDQAELKIAPNPGEPPRPLGEIASGGELSRSLLAIKRVLATRRSGSGLASCLYVFDEVDTGVGGAIAEVIGRKLADVAASHQVLAITHQPQITAFATDHFRVTKEVKEGRTASRLAHLSAEESLAEIARMLGGAVVGKHATAAAAELLDAARATS